MTDSREAKVRERTLAIASEQWEEIGPHLERARWLAEAVAIKAYAAGREDGIEDRWIPVEERLPDLGDWEYGDEVAADDGYRFSDYVPVLVSDGDRGWARLSQATGDHGKTAEPADWLMEDNINSDDETVTHWMPLPEPPSDGIPATPRLARCLRCGLGIDDNGDGDCVVCRMTDAEAEGVKRRAAVTPSEDAHSANFVSEVHPRPDDPSCHVCGAQMVPKGWKCLSCGVTTEPEPELTQREEARIRLEAEERGATIVYAEDALATPQPQFAFLPQLDRWQLWWKRVHEIAPWAWRLDPYLTGMQAEHFIYLRDLLEMPTELPNVSEPTAQPLDPKTHAIEAPAFKYFHGPFEFREPKTDYEGVWVYDGAGHQAISLMWPTHPGEETEAAEQETYRLGRAIADALNGLRTLG